MKTFSITMFSMIAMSGLALAQGAGAKVDAKAGAAAPVKMEMPKPPPEIAATLKAMGARKNCTGTGLGPDMKTEVKFKGTSTGKVTLDGWWITGSMNGTFGEGKAAGKFKMESYMTWDAKLNKWRTFNFVNDGASMVGTAEMKDGKWTGTATMTSAMGEAMFRETGEPGADKKAGMHMWGEISVDKGKTWIKLFDMTCK